MACSIRFRFRYLVGGTARGRLLLSRLSRPQSWQVRPPFVAYRTVDKRRHRCCLFLFFYRVSPPITSVAIWNAILDILCSIRRLTTNAWCRWDWTWLGTWWYPECVFVSFCGDMVWLSMVCTVFVCFDNLMFNILVGHWRCSVVVQPLLQCLAGVEIQPATGLKLLHYLTSKGVRTSVSLLSNNIHYISTS
jgi:hypothetical protein